MGSPALGNGNSMADRIFQLSRWLFIPFAALVASYVSGISLELLADEYGPPPPPPPPPQSSQPGEEKLAVTPDMSSSDSARRERVTTRVVKCLSDCGTRGGWGASAGAFDSKEKTASNLVSGSPAGRSKELTWAASLDRQFGKHVVGFGLAAGDGTAKSFADINNEFQLDIDRDRRSAGVYYGVSLPKFFNLSAQVFGSRDDYKTTWLQGGEISDRAEFDGDGLAYSLRLGNIVPMLLKQRTEILLESSLSYQRVETDTDPYQTSAGIFYSAGNQVSKEWKAELKWRVLLPLNKSYLVPYGGIAYSWLDRSFNISASDPDGSGGRLETSRQADYEMFQGVIGLTWQFGQFSISGNYQKSINEDELERKQYWLMLRATY